MTLKAFVGIDVAFANGKRLPIVVCTIDRGRLKPLRLHEFGQPLPPRGRGNRVALNPKAVNVFALETLEYLRAVEYAHGFQIRRIAIDAPSCYKRPGIHRRAAEVAMDGLRISCFATPNQKEFEVIKKKTSRHLDEGGAENRMPHANQLWMLVGFALFKVLGKYYDCIETFPQAIVNALHASETHKSKEAGVALQLSAVAKHTGWPLGKERSELNQIAFGSLHDKLDAYLSAWVASLSAKECLVCGEANTDVIWIPRLK
jgi:hypothetical protein